MTKRRKQQPVTDHLAQSNAFLREVDDTMRLDRMTNLWLQYRTLFFVTLGATFCVFAAYEYYHQSTEKNLQVQAQQYWDLVQKDVGEDSVKANFSELAENGASGYRLLAQFQIARQFVENENMDDAIKVYATVSADERNMSVYRDLAKFYQAQLLMPAKPEEAAALFSVLAEEKTAYQASALEMLGNISENRGDMGVAKSYYERVMEMPSLSTGIRARVQARLDVITRLMRKS